MQTESKMARLLGTKVRGAVVFATFSLYLVPSHSQLGLFIAEPPFVSDFVAPLSFPYLGCSQSRLEWFYKYPWVQQYCLIPVLGGRALRFLLRLDREVVSFATFCRASTS